MTGQDRAGRIMVLVLLLLLHISTGLSLAYSTRSPAGSHPDRTREKILRTLNNERRRRQLPALEWEPTASDVAQAHSELMGTSRKLVFRPEGASSIDFRLKEAGVPDHMKLLNIMKVHDPANVVTQLLKKPEESNLLHPLVNHVGIGARRRGEWWVTLIFIQRVARIEEFPRTVRDKTRAVDLRGSLLRGFSEPLLKVTQPGGNVLTQELEQQGSHFWTRITFAVGPGEYSVELIASSNMGEVVASLMPVYVGVPAPSGDEETPRGEEEHLTESQMEREMVKLVNKDRRRHGIGPVVFSPELSRTARLHSIAMAEAGIVAHELPGEPDVEVRLEEAGILAVRVGENIARGAGIRAAQRSLMASPAHRETILKQELTEIGIGIFKAAAGDIFVTQHLIEPFRPMNPQVLHRRVLDVLNHHRETLELPLLEEDARLSALAREHTASMAASDSFLRPEDMGKKAAAMGIKYKKATTEVFSTPAPEELTSSVGVSRDDYNKIGIGVVQVGRSSRGVGLIWVTLIYAEVPGQPR